MNGWLQLKKVGECLGSLSKNSCLCTSLSYMKKWKYSTKMMSHFCGVLMKGEGDPFYSYR